MKNEKLIVSIHENAKRLTKEIAAKEWELILILQDVIKHKVHRGYKYPTLQKYLILAHGFSESKAYDFATVAHASLRFKKLEASLASGKISISKARRIAPVLNQENQEEWLHKAHMSTHRGLEKLVAGQNPVVSSHESARYLSANQVEVKFIMTVKEYEELKRAQDLECQKQKRPVSMKSTVVQATKSYLEKHDPVIKAVRAKAKEIKKQIKKSAGTCRENQVAGNKGIRESIPMQIFHQVQLRDMGQCQESLPNGERCQESRWIDIHHIKPVSQGGNNSLHNLITLCKGHHQLEHYRSQ